MDGSEEKDIFPTFPTVPIHKHWGWVPKDVRNKDGGDDDDDLHSSFFLSSYSVPPKPTYIACGNGVSGATGEFVNVFEPVDKTSHDRHLFCSRTCSVRLKQGVVK